MTIVIRPIFNRIAADGSDTIDEFTALQVFGTGIGHFVALIRASGIEAETTLQLIVGQEHGEAAETVAVLPDTAAGEVEAEAMAHAILRTLEIVKEAFVGCFGSPVLDS